ncbi:MULTISPECIES: PqqD family protein [unclassified Ruminococcus]|uniref:PqqD family protein n=1 Tax=unclassified Ruminococcus TaxID=2608920 RepID=UPI00210CE986|nr:MULTISPECIES: PqqD family protein [unclassified Ruminococcus]
MKLKENFVTYDSDGEQIMVSTGGGFSGIVRSNKTAAFIVEQLKTETTQQQIVNAVLAKFEVADKAVVEADVSKILQTLRKIGALDEKHI